MILASSLVSPEQIKATGVKLLSRCSYCSGIGVFPIVALKGSLLCLQGYCLSCQEAVSSRWELETGPSGSSNSGGMTQLKIVDSLAEPNPLAALLVYCPCCLQICLPTSIHVLRTRVVVVACCLHCVYRPVIIFDSPAISLLPTFAEEQDFTDGIEPETFYVSKQKPKMSYMPEGRIHPKVQEALNVCDPAEFVPTYWVGAMPPERPGTWVTS